MEGIPIVDIDDSRLEIVQFTDTHFRDVGTDGKTINIMTKILNVVKPNFVVMTGDIIHGDDLQSADKCNKALLSVLNPITTKDLPFATTFGNHDSLGGLDNSQLLQIQKTQPGCMTHAGNVTGVGNYILLIHSKICGRLIAALFFMDSGGDNVHDPPNAFDKPVGATHYDYIQKDQIDWFHNVNKKLRKYKLDGLPKIVFLHIPLADYNKAWYFHNCLGEKNERISCAIESAPTPLFTEIKKAGVSHVFCGHDHVNDFSGEVDGVKLCYGRVTGWSSHNDSEKNRYPRGARVICISNDGTIFTSICDENGNREEQYSHKRGSFGQWIKYHIETKPLKTVLWKTTVGVLLPFVGIPWAIVSYNRFRKA